MEEIHSPTEEQLREEFAVHVDRSGYLRQAGDFVASIDGVTVHFDEISRVLVTDSGPLFVRNVGSEELKADSIKSSN